MATWVIPGPNNFMLMRLSMRRGRAPPQGPPADDTAPRLGWWSAFWQGFAINITNPKTLLFFAGRAADARAQRPLDRAAAALMGAFGLRLLWVFE